ncbi:hypothetical protein METHPM2_180047 [Pseudomonas sp. PM2]
MREAANPLIFANSPILMYHPQKTIDLKVDFKPKVIGRPRRQLWTAHLPDTHRLQWVNPAP